MQPFNRLYSQLTFFNFSKYRVYSTGTVYLYMIVLFFLFRQEFFRLGLSMGFLV